MSDFFMQGWEESPADRLIHELAKKYHEETEAYDRTVCTGPIIDGSIRPMTPRELGLINKHAFEVRKRITQEALQAGLDLKVLARAIARTA